MNIFKKALENAIISFQNLQEALKDCERINRCKIEISKHSSGAFCCAFDEVAYRICETRTGKTADSYCALADKAIKKLAKGESECNVIRYFDEMLEERLNK